MKTTTVRRKLTSSEAGLEPKLVEKTVGPLGPDVAHRKVPDGVERDVDGPESDDSPPDPSMEPGEVLIRTE